MHWKTKARVLKLISLLPSSFSYKVYYWVQRKFGGLKEINPVFWIDGGVETWKRIIQLGYQPEDKIFFEVGTGRILLVPISYWLMGAKKIITIDLNPYLKLELVKESLQYFVDNPNEIKQLYGPFLIENRYNALLDLHKQGQYTINDILELCNIEYIAPGDATSTKLQAGSVDFHTSFTVFEHMAPEIPLAVLIEGNRVIKDDGLFIHRIDYSDHFSHEDESISNVNFLQFSDRKWNRIAGDRYSYLNRLRHDDMMELFYEAGHDILLEEKDRKEGLIDLINEGNLILDKKFTGKSIDIISTRAAWVASKKKLL